MTQYNSLDIETKKHKIAIAKQKEIKKTKLLKVLLVASFLIYSMAVLIKLNQINQLGTAVRYMLLFSPVLLGIGVVTLISLHKSNMQSKAIQEAEKNYALSLLGYYDNKPSAHIPVTIKNINDVLTRTIESKALITVYILDEDSQGVLDKKILNLRSVAINEETMNTDILRTMFETFEYERVRIRDIEAERVRITVTNFDMDDALYVPVISYTKDWIPIVSTQKI